MAQRCFVKSSYERFLRFNRKTFAMESVFREMIPFSLFNSITSVFINGCSLEHAWSTSVNGMYIEYVYFKNHVISSSRINTFFLKANIYGNNNKKIKWNKIWVNETLRTSISSVSYYIIYVSHVNRVCDIVKMTWIPSKFLFCPNLTEYKIRENQYHAWPTI